MAIALNEAWTKTVDTVDGSTLTDIHSVTTNPNLYLIGAYATFRNNAVAPLASGATWNGVAMTDLGRQEFGGYVTVGFFGIINPAQGSHSFIVSFGAQTDIQGTAACTSYSGVDQTTPAGTFIGAQGTGTSASVSPISAVGDVCISVIEPSASTPSVSGAQTLRWAAGTHDEESGGDAPGSAGTTAMSWTFSSADWTLGAIAIHPVTVTGILPHRQIPGPRGWGRG